MYLMNTLNGCFISEAENKSIINLTLQVCILYIGKLNCYGTEEESKLTSLITAKYRLVTQNTLT